MAQQPHVAFDQAPPDPYVGCLHVVDRPKDIKTVRWTRADGRPLDTEGSAIRVDGDILFFTRLNLAEAGIYRAVMVDHGGGEQVLDYRLEFRTEAVVVVHGIGEQTALDPASTYAAALARSWDHVDEDPFHVPDTEIRTRRFRINWRPAHVRPTSKGGAVYYTDVYEHYWQPHVRDSQFRHFGRFLTNRMIGTDVVPARFHDLVVLLIALLSPVLVGLFLSGALAVGGDWR